MDARAALIVVVLGAGCGRLRFAPVDDAPATDTALAADTLGQGPFGPASLITAISTGEGESEATFTADRLELVFRRGPPGDGDLFVSTRLTADDPWGQATAITELNTALHEYTPGISADGLTLFFSSNRPGGVGMTDLWVATRPVRGSSWSTPILVPGVNSANNDVNPMLHGGALWFARQSTTSLDVYAAAGTPPVTWATPVLRSELSSAGYDASPCLWGGGLHIMFTSNRASMTFTDYDLYSATRASLADPFGQITRIDELITTVDDWDMWISEDGRYATFGSNRRGNYDIYETSR